MAQLIDTHLFLRNVLPRRGLGDVQSFFSSVFSPPQATTKDSKPSATTTPVFQTTPASPTTVSVKTTSVIAATPGADTSSDSIPTVTNAPSSSASSSTAPPPLITGTASSLAGGIVPSNTVSSSDTFKPAFWTISSKSAPSATASPSSTHHANAGPIAAGVTIGLISAIIIFVSAFVYYRRRQQKKRSVWKHSSRSRSPLMDSSDDLTAIYETEKFEQTDMPALPEPAYTGTFYPKSFKDDDTSTLRSFATLPPLDFQKPTIVYVGPAVTEEDHRLSTSSSGSIDDDDDDDFKEIFIDLETEPASPSSPDRILPPSLQAAGLKPTSNDTNSGILPQKTNAFPLTLMPGQVSGAVDGGGTSSVRRKPVPGVVGTELHFQ